MQYCEYPTTAQLARSVACIWTLEGDACEGAEAPQPILPDGRAEFVMHLGDGFARVDQGAMQRQQWAIFAGQLDRPLTLRPTGRIAVLGVRFRPDGAARFTPVPPHEFVGRTVGAALASSSLANVARRVRESAASLPDAVRLVERLLAPAERHDAGDRRVASVVDAVVRSGGRVAIESAARQTGVPAPARTAAPPRRRRAGQTTRAHHPLRTCDTDPRARRESCARDPNRTRQRLCRPGALHSRFSRVCRLRTD